MIPHELLHDPVVSYRTSRVAFSELVKYSNLGKFHENELAINLNYKPCDLLIQHYPVRTIQV